MSYEAEINIQNQLGRELERIKKFIEKYKGNLIEEKEKRKITSRIGLVPLRKLLIHEKILPKALQRLIEEIKGDGYLKHPVIVDENELVTLDGMHRVAAVRGLGYEYMSAYLVDYDNEKITLGRWYRLVRNMSGPRVVDRIISILEDQKRFEIVDDSRDKAERMLNERKAITSLMHNSNVPEGKYRIVCCENHVESIKQIFDYVEKIGSFLRFECGFKIEYDIEKGAEEMIMKGRLPLF